VIRVMKNIILLFISGLFLFSLPFVHAEENSVSVPYTITGVDADDIEESLKGTLKFKKGESSKEIKLTIKDDKVFEKDETFSVELGESPDGVTLGENKTVTGTIVNDDTASITFSLVAKDAKKEEGDGGDFTVFYYSIDKPKVPVGEFKWEVTGTGDNPADADDFRGGKFPSGTVDYIEGNKAEVFVKGDGEIEKDEDFVVAITEIRVPSYLKYQLKAATGTILNDDEKPPLTITSTTGETRLSENSGKPFEVTFTLNQPAPKGGVKIEYTTFEAIRSGVEGERFEFADLEKPRGSLTIAEGEKSVKLTLAIKDDKIYEGPENFNVQIRFDKGQYKGKLPSDTWEYLPGPYYIEDDDIPSVSIAPQDAEENKENEDEGPFTFTAKLDTKVKSPTEITWAIEGSSDDGDPTEDADFVATTGTVTIPADQTEQKFEIKVANDDVVEANEKFTVTLSAPTGMQVSNNTTTATILNDDDYGVSIGESSSSSAKEGSDTAFSFLFTLHNGTIPKDFGIPYTISGTGITEDDFIGGLKGAVTMEAGQQSATLKLKVKDDALVEEDEKFTVSISEDVTSLANEDSEIDIRFIRNKSATGTIKNDDILKHVLAMGLPFGGKPTSSEGAKTELKFPISIHSNMPDKKVAQDFSIQYEVTGKGIDKDDFDQPLKGSVQFKKGTSFSDIHLTYKNDNIVEEDEKFTVSLLEKSFPSGVVSGDTSNAAATGIVGTGTILNDDKASVVNDAGVDADGDGVPKSQDCDDADANVFPGNAESCGDRIDNNCDGSVDEAGEPCSTTSTTNCSGTTPIKCSDGSCVTAAANCPTTSTSLTTTTSCAAPTPYLCPNGSCAEKAASCPKTSTSTDSSNKTTEAKVVKKVVSVTQKEGKTQITKGKDKDITFTIELSCPEGSPVECSANTCAKTLSACPTITIEYIDNDVDFSSAVKNAKTHSKNATSTLRKLERDKSKKRREARNAKWDADRRSDDVEFAERRIKSLEKRLKSYKKSPSVSKRLLSRTEGKLEKQKANLKEAQRKKGESTAKHKQLKQEEKKLGEQVTAQKTKVKKAKQLVTALNKELPLLESNKDKRESVRTERQAAKTEAEQKSLDAQVKSKEQAVKDQEKKISNIIKDSGVDLK
jgi:Putative metal-binding motif/Calx-beta domain